MGLNYLCDTNTIIYFLQRQFSEAAELYIDELFKREQPVMSTITEIELLSWKSVSETDDEIIKKFIGDSKVIELEPAIKTKASEIRKKTGIKLPDAIIAATALVYNLTLITRNVKDFKKVGEISIVNPWEM